MGKLSSIGFTVNFSIFCVKLLRHFEVIQLPDAYFLFLIGLPQELLRSLKRDSELEGQGLTLNALALTTLPLVIVTRLVESCHDGIILRSQPFREKEISGLNIVIVLVVLEIYFAPYFTVCCPDCLSALIFDVE